ncbi:MAG: alanyl-tRNA editing protein [Rhodospirillaceae bacterium]|nr:alanyl-tRNA editing protein [Rhodospirillaceae bacterium]
MSTETLFHDDAYRKTATATIQLVAADPKGRPALLLDRTIFYPQGGGQKGDRGSITFPFEIDGIGTEAKIADTTKKGGDIFHVLADAETAAVLMQQGEIEGCALSLDWDFRYRQMRLHSASHLLHCFIERALGRNLPAPSFSDQTADSGTNRYDVDNLIDDAAFGAAASELNAFLAKGAAIRTYPDPERGKEGYRWWACEEWRIPCGGTHVADAREVGAVVPDISRKKGRTTTTFTLRDPA